jgi:hypothetical protein
MSTCPSTPQCEWPAGKRAIRIGLGSRTRRHRLLLLVVDQLLAFIWLLLVLPPIWLLPPASIVLRAFSVAAFS